MPVIPAGFGQANVKFTGPGAPTGAECTFGFDNDTNQFALDICDLIIAAWTGSFLVEQCNQVDLAAVLVKLGPNDTGPFAEVADGTSGTVVSASEVPNTAALCRKNTNTGGRQGRGRMFIPGVRESDFGSDGTMSAPDLAGWQTAADTFLGDLQAATIPMVLLRSESSPPGAPLIVTSLSMSATAATQRRRLRR